MVQRNTQGSQIDRLGADKAAVVAIIMQTSSPKLQQRAIQENPTYEKLVNLGISQEQEKKKASSIAAGEEEKIVRRVKQVKLQKKDPDKNRLSNRQKEGSKKKCGICRWSKSNAGDTFSARDRTCNACHKKGHYAKWRNCVQTQSTARIESATDSDTDTDESVGRIMLEEVGRLQKEIMTDTIFTTLRIKCCQKNKKGKKIKVATDTGVRKPF